MGKRNGLRRSAPGWTGALWILAAAIGASPSARAEPADATPESLLGAAFANRYDVDTIYDLDLVIRDRQGHEQRRTLHTVSKRIDGRTRSIGRLIEPPNLRGMTVMIETERREREVFVYLPALKRVRRISGSQRGDAFLGSDFTYEDFEPQYEQDFALSLLPPREVAGERCTVIHALPRDARSYAAVEFAVAESDHAILEYRYFAAGEDTPYRVIDTPRSAMVERNGHVLPTRFSARNLVRETSTELVIQTLTVDPPIADRIFSMRTLEQQLDLP